MTELNDQSLLAHWYRHRNAEAAVAPKPQIDVSGAYEAGLQKPGTYTVVLFTYPGGNYLSRVHLDYRVVEVPESELNLDFDLTH